VELKNYEVLLDHDLNPKSALRAVPKLTLKHISPNNFQKMSVSIAAQVAYVFLVVIYMKCVQAEFISRRLLQETLIP